VIGFVLFKLPFIFISIINYVFNIEPVFMIFGGENNLLKTICSFYKVCDYSNEIGLCLFICSILFQFFILVKLDKNFKLKNIRMILNRNN
jgi:hypothetical protein